ncbi:MAG: type II secretion system protein M [Gammaproteobacteria bacterium]|nr:type II secretion system protein M [Gammaproteobacteria bacterium]
MIDFSTHIEPLKNWLNSLATRERYIVITGAIALLISLFYLIVWEPVFNHLETQQQHYQSQRQLLNWMQDAAEEARLLQSSGAQTASRFNNQSVSSLAERSALSMGVKRNISKQESNKKGVNIQLQQADFDRVILWLNDMQTKYNITASNIQIEKQAIAGAVNVRVALDRTTE